MFCSQCGKKVLESMLFCPFCGAPIVIPDQPDGEGTGTSAPVQPEVHANADGRAFKQEARSKVEEPVVEDVEDGADAPGRREEGREAPQSGYDRRAVEEFVPLDMNTDWEREEVVPQEAGPEFEPLDLEQFETPDPPRREPPRQDREDGEISERLSRKLREEPVRLQGHGPDLSHVKPPKPERTGTRKPPNTHVPPKAFNPDDLFLDGGDRSYDDEDDDFEFEERECGGFFARHIRGIVALSLTVLVLAIVAGWAMTDTGQQALAQANLAWRASAYDAIAYADYQNGHYLRAAINYERALSRDSDNYTYANNAAIAYYQAGDTELSAGMAERAVEIDPTRMDAYELLLRLYPDAATRPDVVAELLQTGYRLTGNESLNVE